MEKDHNIPAYRNRLKAERADELYIRILQKLTGDKLYRDPKYTTAKLAADLHTNTRYISAAVAVRTGLQNVALSQILPPHCRRNRAAIGICLQTSLLQSFCTTIRLHS